MNNSNNLEYAIKSGKNICSIPPHLIGYNDKSIIDLKVKYIEAGCEYYQPQLGAGPQEIITQAVTWLNMNPFYSSVAVVVGAEAVKNLFYVARNWHKKHPPKAVKGLKVKNIVYFNFSEDEEEFGFELDISKDYNVSQITEIINNSKSIFKK